MTATSNQKSEYPNRKQRLLASIPPMSPFHPRSTINPVISRQDDVITISDDDDEDYIIPNNDGLEEQQSFDDWTHYQQVQEFHPLAQESCTPIHEVLPSRQGFQPPRQETHQPNKVSKPPTPTLLPLGQRVLELRDAFKPSRHRIQPKDLGIPRSRHQVLFQGHEGPSPRRKVLPKGYGAFGFVQEIHPQGHGAPSPRRKVLPKGYGAFGFVQEIHPQGHGAPSPSRNVTFRGHGAPSPSRNVTFRGHGAPSPSRNVTFRGHGAPSPSRNVTFRGHGAPSMRHEVLHQSHGALNLEREIFPQGQGGPRPQNFYEGNESASSRQEVPFRRQGAPSPKHKILPQGHGALGLDHENLVHGHGTPSPRREVPPHKHGGPNLSHVIQQTRRVSLTRRQSIASQPQHFPPTTIYQPQCTTDYQPSATTAYQPSATTSYQPSATTIYHLASTTTYQPPSTTPYQTSSTTACQPSSTIAYEPPSTTPFQPTFTIAYEPPSKTPYQTSSTTAYEPPSTCKLVQKLSDNTWIELDVSCDGQSLEQVSNTIKQFAASYNQIPLEPQNMHNECHCHQVAPCSSSQRPVAKEAPPTEEAESMRSFQTSKYQIPFSEDLVHPPCSICQAPAESSHLNYGAHSCFSCRAFFRRSVQIQIYHNFDCIFGGQCLITPGNRSECRKCRFEKCLKQGMKISAVLNQAQKRTRFRKQLGLKRMDQVNKAMQMKVALRTFRKKIAPR